MAPKATIVAIKRQYKKWNDFAKNYDMYASLLQSILFSHIEHTLNYQSHTYFVIQSEVREVMQN